MIINNCHTMSVHNRVIVPVITFVQRVVKATAYDNIYFTIWDSKINPDNFSPNWRLAPDYQVKDMLRLGMRIDLSF